MCREPGSAGRFMVQTRFDKENTACDDCIITGLVMSVQGCMHAQQQIEIDEIKKNGWSGMNPMILQSMPPSQQHMFQKARESESSGDA
ncbi:unnamed protein product [Cladocopium goreaui]|uniref:ATP-dependent helicase SGS1 n=1 Tax=Cladocopium goreaui TaxID=2562237 RepID=A0A9P1CB92_9DINO|nr:unnamed protein product [Cladocopium goreaui]